MWRSRHARAVVPSDGEGPAARSPMPGDPGDRGQCSHKVQQLLWPSSPRAQRCGEWQRRAARPTQTDGTNGRMATEQRDDAIPRPASSVQRPASVVHGPVRPSIHPMPASWPRGLRVPFQQGARSPRLGFWLHLLTPVLQQALGTFDQGPGDRARHSPTGGRHSRHPPFTIASSASGTLHLFVWFVPRAGGLASKIKIIPANRPSFSPPPLKALVPECPFCCCLVSSHDGIPASSLPPSLPSPSDTHAQPASASGRIAFALLPAVTLPPVFLRLSFTWRCYP